MKFIKLFGSGLDKNRRDVRDKIWALFHCNICGKTHDIDVTNTINTFQFERERKCPHCGLVDEKDKEANLKSQLDKLTADKTRIEIELEKIERELSELSARKEVENGIQSDKGSESSLSETI